MSLLQKHKEFWRTYMARRERFSKQETSIKTSACRVCTLGTTITVAMYNLYRNYILMDLEIQIQELRSNICREIGEEFFPYARDFSLKSQKHYDDFKATYPEHHAQLTRLLTEYQQTVHCPACSEE